MFLPTLYKEWVFSLQLSFQKESWYKRKHSKKKVGINQKWKSRIEAAQAALRDSTLEMGMEICEE